MTHTHDHAPAAGSGGGDHLKRLAIAFGITFTILVVEVIGALVSGRRYAMIAITTSSSAADTHTAAHPKR